MGCATSTPADVQATAASTAAKYAAPPAAASPPAAAEVATVAATGQKPAEKAPPAPAPAATQQATTTNGSTVQAEPLKTLNTSDASVVQATLLKVSTLIQKFAEGRSERTTPVQALRRALDLVVADAHGVFASVQTLSETKDAALFVAMVGAPDGFAEQNRLQRLARQGFAAESILDGNLDFLSWSVNSKSAAPVDWQLLASLSGIKHISAVPVKMNDKFIGLLTLGLEGLDQVENPMWPTYLQLVAASISSMIKDNSIPKYMQLVIDVQESSELDTLMHKLVQHFRTVLGHTNNHHVWYRVALTSANNTASTIFDDLTQVPASLMQRALGQQASASAAGSSNSFRLLKEVQAAGGVMRTVVAMKNTVMKIAVHNRQQVMIPDVQKLINQSGNVSIDIFNTRLIKPPTSVLVFPLKVKQHIFGVIFCMSSVQSDFADVSPRLRELCEVMSPHLLQSLSNGLNNEYKNMQQQAQMQVQNPDVSGNSMSGTPRAMSFSKQDSIGHSLGQSLGVSMSGDSFMYTQSRSSTGALVTGLTEKLNQKRIKSSMDISATNALADLQVTNLLGEGGFAKVFRGLWRGLVVGVKVVCDDGKNEKMVMKNAHEIAILSALSHPNIVSAYTCLTDVLVRELVNMSMRSPNTQVLNSPAYKYLVSMEDKSCHIEVIEYCDLGNLSTALKNQVFVMAPQDKVLATVAAAAEAEAAGGGVAPVEGSGVSATQRRPPQMGQKINVRTLVLTLIEIASAMGYLHRMGVVHCDLKPANVLLKSSNIDLRGFTAKVSDFGLSRVEDDDNSSSFPFNSCGTAAYVAPEALICNKKVNSSVDVYAFGILMWEMYTGQRPYGNMKQQQLVEEVVMRGLRPKFPPHAPPTYVQLAQACWSGSPQARPTFEEALSTLNGMLQAVDDREIGSVASGSFGSLTDAVEYMPGFTSGGGAQARAAAPVQQRGYPPPQQQQQRVPPMGSGNGRQFVQQQAGLAHPVR